MWRNRFGRGFGPVVWQITDDDDDDDDIYISTGWPYGQERIMSIEGVSSRWHYVEESFWKRLWTGRLTDYWWWWWWYIYLLDDLKDRRGYCQLKEEALDRTMWRNRFGRGFGPVVWQITDDDDDDDTHTHTHTHYAGNKWISGWMREQTKQSPELCATRQGGAVYESACLRSSSWWYLAPSFINCFSPPSEMLYWTGLG